MSLTVQTRCRRGGTGFEPDRAAVLAGRWRLCPACRERTEPGPPAALPSDERARTLKARDWMRLDRRFRERGGR